MPDSERAFTNAERADFADTALRRIEKTDRPTTSTLDADHQAATVRLMADLLHLAHLKYGEGAARNMADAARQLWELESKAPPLKPQLDQAFPDF